MILMFTGALIYLFGGPEYQQAGFIIMIVAIFVMALSLGGRR